MRKVLQEQIEWWEIRREIVLDKLDKCKDEKMKKALESNLKYVDDKLVELKIKAMRRRKVGK